MNCTNSARVCLKCKSKLKDQIKLKLFLDQFFKVQSNVRTIQMQFWAIKFFMQMGVFKSIFLLQKTIIFENYKSETILKLTSTIRINFQSNEDFALIILFVIDLEICQISNLSLLKKTFVTVSINEGKR